eukprot:gb/GECH01014398.1/.p1 GENE.gb/GECH01014398.1/~~gb/GECH01014398.1/.p1  ORF type:complete len:291 (+),score=66.22 gb/GECH01014398.1/:1-873(+)
MLTDKIKIKNITESKLNQTSQPKPVDISKGIIISSNPSDKRTCFPFKQTPPFEVLDSKELKHHFFPDNDTHPSGEVSKYMNVGSCGVCMVTTRTVSLSNAHAGCHADQPLHFNSDPPFDMFSDKHYNGNATILDLSFELVKKNNKTVTLEILQKVANNNNINLNQVERLLIASYNTETGYNPPQDWDSNSMHFDKECADYLSQLKHLVLVGIDSPSVDHPNAAPIGEHSHGSFLSGGVAILENLDFSNIFGAKTHNKFERNGVISTIWNPCQKFPDAKGAIVIFYAENKY